MEEFDKDKCGSMACLALKLNNLNKGTWGTEGRITTQRKYI